MQITHRFDRKLMTDQSVITQKTFEVKPRIVLQLLCAGRAALLVFFSKFFASHDPVAHCALSSAPSRPSVSQWMAIVSMVQLSRWQEAAKAVAFRSEGVTRLARLSKVMRLRLAMSVHDADYHAIATLGLKNAIALDVGANMGQSAIAMLRVEPTLAVTSIEPNPVCWPQLRFIAWSFGRRMTFIPGGAGEAPGELPFYVPVRSSRQLIEEGTFDAASLETPASVSRIGVRDRDYKLTQIVAPIIPIDDLNLSPKFVKIDVQGFELAVLKGMRRTIAECKPVLMLESGEGDHSCADYLEPLGYRTAFWNGSRLGDVRRPGSFNVFMLPG